MTPIFCDHIDHQMAWRGGDFSKDDISFDLSHRQVAALEDVVLRVRKARLPLGEIGPDHCHHRWLDDDLERVFDDIQEGRGIVIVRGLPVAAHSVDDIKTMFWALGTHFGVTECARLSAGPSQGRDPTRPAGECSRLPKPPRVVAACRFGADRRPDGVRQAREGGYSQYASGLALHNEMLATRPDLMPVLYRRFPYHRRDEQAPDCPAHHTL